MKRQWFSIFIVALLLSLLGVLAALQYVWLGQISDGERERLQRVVRSDSERFAEDFNREVQNAYFNLSTSPEVWKSKNWSEFNERYRFWQEKTQYPELIKNIYFVEVGENKPLLRYEKEKGEFTAADWTDNLSPLKSGLEKAGELQQIEEKMLALIMPVHADDRKLKQILVRTKQKESIDVETPPRTRSRIELPERTGTMVIELDEEVIKKQIFPDLFKKYFSGADGSTYFLAIKNSRAETLFQTGEVRTPDAESRFFDLAPDNLFFFANREILPRGEGEKKGVVFSNSQVESLTIKENGRPANRKIKMTSGEFQVLEGDSKPRVRVFDTQLDAREGIWSLSVQHSAGSLEQFVANTRRKNLAISFGILSLLAVSIGLIFISTQRAKRLAQRQIDFVSSVSHEFRTPLAVIYSAGENLADGVARESEQISRYGHLIKGEGRKLSAMVEQILEFAGARAGKKKYDLKTTEVGPIVEKSLAECRALIDAKGFQVETDIAEKLPLVKADAAALSQAIQNLIANSVKYSNDVKFIKVSAKNGGGRVKISVEDRGIGIAAQDLKHIFEPFYRAKAVVDEQIHGNGLGLSLVKQTVEAHGGKITAESEPGKGSKFCIQLAVIS